MVFNMTIVNLMLHLYLLKSVLGQEEMLNVVFDAHAMSNVHTVVHHDILFMVVTCSNYYISLLLLTVILSLLVKYFPL